MKSKYVKINVDSDWGSFVKQQYFSLFPQANIFS